MATCKSLTVANGDGSISMIDAYLWKNTSREKICCMCITASGVRLLMSLAPDTPSHSHEHFNHIQTCVEPQKIGGRSQCPGCEACWCGHRMGPGGVGVGMRPVVPYHVYWPLVPLVLPRVLGGWFCTYVDDCDAVGVLYCPADAPGCSDSD